MSHPFAFGSKTLPGLAKVNEEAGEVVQVCGKLMMTGGAADHWDGSDLHARLMAELADLEAAIAFFKSQHITTTVDRNLYNNRFGEKLRLFYKWHAEQRQ